MLTMHAREKNNGADEDDDFCRFTEVNDRLMRDKNPAFVI